MGCGVCHCNVLSRRSDDREINTFPRPCEGDAVLANVFWPCLSCNVCASSNKSPEFCQQNIVVNEQCSSLLWTSSELDLGWTHYSLAPEVVSVAGVKAVEQVTSGSAAKCCC